MIAFRSSHAPLRICFVCDEYPPALHGGIGSLIQSLARSLVADGHRVRVIGTAPRTCTAPRYEEDHGVKVWRLPAPHWRGGWLLARYNLFRRVSQWARKDQIDVIEVVDFAGPAAGWPKLPVPVIARLHGSATYFARELDTSLRRHDFLFERASLRRADYICSISQYAADRTKEAFDQQDTTMDILHDFVDVPTRAGSRVRTGNDVVFSGTLTAKKGVIELFQAWPLVVAQHQDARLHIYGKDARCDDGRSMKETVLADLDPSLHHSVHFHGHVPREQLFAALRRARAGVFPSYSETFGLGPVESMAAGCPTIYGHCGCSGEIVRDGIDGLLVDPSSPGQIAGAVARVLGDQRLADRLSASGQARVQQQFSPQVMIYKNEEFYRDCIRDFARRRQGSPAVTDRLAQLIRHDQVSRRRRKQRPRPVVPVLRPIGAL